MKPEVKDLRACPEVGGTVMFPPDSSPYPFGVDPYWHGTKVGTTGQRQGWEVSGVVPTIACCSGANCCGYGVRRQPGRLLAWAWLPDSVQPVGL